MTVYTPPTEEDPRETDRKSEPQMNDRPTNRRTKTNRHENSRTMRGVSHTNPLTGETFGESMVFERGKTVVADGGEAGARDDDADAGHDDETDDDVSVVGDVDHTPRENAPDTSAVYERGKKASDEDEEDEE